MILEQGGVSVGIWVRNGVQVRGMEIMIINILNNTRMKDLYRYIFTKAYFFCITVFKEKEFPQYFASGVVTLALVTQIVIILELIEYLSFPTRVNIFGEYHGYFAVFCWGVVLLYINNKKRYLAIIKSCKELPDKKKKNLKVYSIIYLLFLFVSFFLLGALIREYNIAHPK